MLLLFGLIFSPKFMVRVFLREYCIHASNLRGCKFYGFQAIEEGYVHLALSTILGDDWKSKMGSSVFSSRCFRRCTCKSFALGSSLLFLKVSTLVSKHLQESLEGKTVKQAIVGFQNVLP